MYYLSRLFFAFLVLISTSLSAQVIDDIKIKGLQRVEPGVIFDSIPFEIGDELVDIDTSELIKYIYKTNQFRDVAVEFDSGVLTIIVSENQSLLALNFLEIN